MNKWNVLLSLQNKNINKNKNPIQKIELIFFFFFSNTTTSPHTTLYITFDIYYYLIEM